MTQKHPEGDPFQQGEAIWLRRRIDRAVEFAREASRANDAAECVALMQRARTVRDATLSAFVGANLAPADKAVMDRHFDALETVIQAPRKSGCRC